MAIVVSASRRTDIPSFHALWFYDRLREGAVDVANPYNPRQIRHVSLDPENVACFVFWTRDARPMLRDLGRLESFAYYFHVTVTGYGPPLEPQGLSSDEAIGAVKELAARIGSQRVIWRYDPVLTVGRYDAAWHAEHFAMLVDSLAGSVRHCVISAYDSYRHTDARLEKAGLAPSVEATRMGRTGPLPVKSVDLLGSLIEIGARRGVRVALCAEPEIESKVSSYQCSCIDAGVIEELGGRSFSHTKDKNQREGCRCVESVDIGSYGTCPRGCLYCYANRKAHHA